jgi:hypothetical protein
MGADNENNGYIYDVAFSYAGEQRDFVNRVYKILTDNYKLKVFYDQNPEIQANLWGKDLAEELEKIYGEESKCCVLFISKEYKVKYWTNYEKISVLTKAIKEKGDYLLPARFDDTEIPGILGTDSYINVSQMSPDDFSELIILKIGISSKHRDEHRVLKTKDKAPGKKDKELREKMKKVRRQKEEAEKKQREEGEKGTKGKKLNDCLNKGKKIKKKKKN